MLFAVYIDDLCICTNTVLAQSNRVSYQKARKQNTENTSKPETHRATEEWQKAKQKITQNTRCTHTHTHTYQKSRIC